MPFEQEVSFRQLVTSAARGDLLKLLDPAAVDLLRKLHPEALSDDRLVPLVLGGGGPADYLSDSSRRPHMFDLLTPSQARLLGAHLGLTADDNPHRLLRKASPELTPQQIATVLAFFGVDATSGGRPTSNANGLAVAGYPLFPHQRSTMRRVQERLYSNARRVVLHMPTGAGKTRTAMSIVAEHLRAREPSVVVWLASSEELLEQAASEFEIAWHYVGNREVDLLRFWGSRNPDFTSVNDGVIVAGLGKMYAADRRIDNFLPSIADLTSLVVYDEAHQSIAATYAIVLEILATKRRQTSALGLTATPGRTWNDVKEDARLAQFWEGEKVMLEIEGYENPVQYLIDSGYLARPSFRTVNVSPGVKVTPHDLEVMEDSLDLPPNTLSQLADAEQWNAAVVKEVRDLIEGGHRRVLVFATTVRQALVLASVMRAMGYNARAVTGSTAKAERESILSQYTNNSEKPMTLFNYGVLTTGFDAPATSATVIARPTKSLVLFSQMAGRAMRGALAGGNEQAEIVSVIDPELPGFGDPAEAFTNWEDVW